MPKTRFSIPTELIEQINRNNVIPLVGEGINRGVLPTLTDLATDLAARCDYPEEEPLTLARVAAYYQLTSGDRHSLIEFLRRRLEHSRMAPSPSYNLLVKLQPKVIVTTCYDRLLERAVQTAGYAYTPVIANEEVAYSEEQQMMLVWLLGALDRPNSLVVTEDDHRRFMTDRKSLSYILRAELCRRTWLFLGFETQDEWFLNFYDGVVRDLDLHNRRAYIVGTNMNAYARAWWSKRAHILDVEVEPFLSELVRQTDPVRPQNQTNGVPTEDNNIVYVPLPDRPYKRLDFYETKDAPIFFGREQEIQTLCSLIHAHRLVLFYGPSGAGKTSLLLAGVLPRLEQTEMEYQPFYLRTLDDPIKAIGQAVQRHFTDVELPASGSLVDFLAAAARSAEGPLIIVLDQFEEFFTRFTPQRRQTFIDELGSLIDSRDIPVKVVLTLREDWLAAVNEIRHRIPEIFNTDMRLLPLTQDQARLAISGPAERMGVQFEPALIDQLLADLAEDDNPTSEQLIMPPQLQLICTAVYDQARADGRRRITLADYENVGGGIGILDRFIENALQVHKEESRELAKRILMSLVTSHQTKGGRQPASLGAELGVDAETVKPILSRLTEQRLLRRLDENDTYELAHDILAATIAGWISETDRQLKEIREQLERDLADWRHDDQILLSQGKFRRIDQMRERIHFDVEAAAFLLRSAVLYNESVEYWLEKSEPDIQQQILLEMLTHDTNQARLTAAQWLTRFSHEEVAVALAQTSLADNDGVVRDTAADSLGHLEKSSENALLLLANSMDTGQKQDRSRATRALALAGNISPELLNTLTSKSRWKVRRELGQIRMQRDRSKLGRMTAAGVAGGAVGIGLGLGIPWVLETTATLQTTMDLIFILPLFAVFGAIAGGWLAFGIGTGEALFDQQGSIGRVLTAVIIGGLGLAVIFTPVMILGGTLIGIVGAGMLGVLLVLGIVLPRSWPWPIRLLTGALSGALGFVILGYTGFDPLHLEILPVGFVLLFGFLCGGIQAFSILMAENQENKKVGFHDDTFN